jgi:diphthine-ammonia ligase
MPRYCIVGLVSGGKDSIYSLVEAKRQGHEIVCLANLYPVPTETPSTATDKEEASATELDSHCFQTVAHTVIPAIAECMGLPLVRRQTKGVSHQRSLIYASEGQSGSTSDEDEVEDLYQLLLEVKTRFPHVNAVSAGAIQSNYQRLRVEAVAKRLGLQPLAFLWQREQHALLKEMLDSGLEAVLVKVAACGLTQRMLGRPLSALQNALRKAHDEYGVSVVGEGGEYESSVLYCPQLFKGKRIVFEETVVVDESKDDKWNVCAFLHVKKCRVVPIEDEEGANTGRDVISEKVAEKIDSAAAAETTSASPPAPVVSPEKSHPTLATPETILLSNFGNTSPGGGIPTLTDGVLFLPGLIASVPKMLLQTPTDSGASSSNNTEGSISKGSVEMRVALGHATTALMDGMNDWIQLATDGKASLGDALMLRLFTADLSGDGEAAPSITSSATCFDAINSSYNAFFESSPSALALPASQRAICPSRSCVEVPLDSLVDPDVSDGFRIPILVLQGFVFVGSSSPLALRELKGGRIADAPSSEGDASAASGATCDSASCLKPGVHYERSLLHVRSLSKWAPLCIGPYSQANSLYPTRSPGVAGPSLHLIAGQIGLVPETMTMAQPLVEWNDTGITTIPRFIAELRQSLQNAIRVVECTAGMQVPLLPPEGFVWPSLKTKLAKAGAGAGGEAMDVDVDGGYESEDQVVKAAVRRKETFNKSPLIPALVFVSTAGISSEGEGEKTMKQRELLITKALAHLRSAYGIRIHLLSIIRVPALPRGALVEVEVQAWSNGTASGERLSRDDTAAFSSSSSAPMDGESLLSSLNCKEELADPEAVELGEWREPAGSAIRMRSRTLLWHHSGGSDGASASPDDDEDDDDPDARLLRESAKGKLSGGNVVSSASIAWGMLAVHLYLQPATLLYEGEEGQGNLDSFVSLALRSHSSFLSEVVAGNASANGRATRCHLAVYFPAPSTPPGEKANEMPWLDNAERALKKLSMGTRANGGFVTSCIVPTVAAAAGGDKGGKVTVILTFDCTSSSPSPAATSTTAPAS